MTDSKMLMLDPGLPHYDFLLKWCEGVDKVMPIRPGNGHKVLGKQETRKKRAKLIGRKHANLRLPV